MQVHPSEYAFQDNSVNRAERPSANCRKYPLSHQITEHYTHCDGTQLRLTDSDLGSQKYRGSDYYVWPAKPMIRQLLFIFPTTVNLTMITLHYYSSNSVQLNTGLPRLRFYNVPDDFDIWNAPSASYNQYGEIVALSPGDQAGNRNVSISINFSTQKVLMIKYKSGFNLAVSEVQFFNCRSKLQSLHTL